MSRHTTLVLRGILAFAASVALIVTVVAYGSGALSGDPELTSDIPPQSVGVAERSTVEYRGVVVGTVESVHSDARRTRLGLRMAPEQLTNIPAGVRSRVLPRTLFGDQYVDLVPPAQSTGARLDVSTPIPADTSGETIELYTAYKRLFDVLTKVRPAKIDAALSAVSKALSGHGERLGRMIDQVHDLTDSAPALLTTFGDTLGFLADLSGQLTAVAPQGVQALKDATALSQDLVNRRGQLEALLSGGLTLSDQARQILGDNKDRLIHLVGNGGRILDVTADNANGLSGLYDSFGTLLNGLQGTLRTGRLPVNLDVTLDRNTPYTGADCPRYGSITGPNCVAAPKPAPPPEPPTFGGSSGPVGSAQEAAALEKFASRLPGAPELPDLRQSIRQGVLSLLAGPILRGSEVKLP
ncbi:MCE family protein [Amycolatopsis sp. NPDC058986]|uniref:MCE family protein n=1 Tax=unclassified Amycolatopsis TaxID=2618356 RepID=UPI003670CC93